jgi:hypothetical protein
MIDEEEQPSVDPELLAWATTEEFDFVSGRLVGPKSGIAQTRSVLFVKPEYFVLVDHVTGEGAHKLEQLFHLPLGEAEVDPAASRLVTKLPKGANLAAAWAGPGELRLDVGHLPKGRADVQEAPLAVWEQAGELPVQIVTVLAPVVDGDVAPEIVEADTSHDVVSLTVRWGEARVDRFAIAPDVRELSIGDFVSTARAAWVRREGERVSRVVVAAD